MPVWIDSHTHLESFARKGELGAVLGRARSAGLEAVITVGTCPGDWALYRKIAGQHPGFVAYTVGLHPCDVGPGWESDVLALAAYFHAAPLPVAMGEIGLDRFHLSSDPGEAAMQFKRQREAFTVQLALARDVGCPIVIHSRGAFDDCLQQVVESGVDGSRVVFHCFSEGVDAVRRLNAIGGRASFTGIITYKNGGQVREAAVAQGIERLMLETDAPYLTPVPHRGKGNEPAFLRDIGHFTANLFSMDLEEFARQTSAGTRQFFNLS